MRLHLHRHAEFLPYGAGSPGSLAPGSRSMSWGKVLFGFAIILGVFIAWFRLMKSMSGGGGSGVDMRVGGDRRKDTGINELEQIIAAHRSGSAAAGANTMSPVATTQVPSAPPPAGAAWTLPALLKAPVLLSGAHKLAYLIFKSGAPDHHVFARVPLGELLPLEVAGADLGRHAFALVVCRPDFTVAAAVDIADPATTQRMALVNSALQTASIRHIVLEPRRMPKPRDIRALLDAH